MSSVKTGINLGDHDGIYQRLVALHDGLGDEESFRANARLILILINHIGDRRVIDEAIEMARKSARKGEL